MEQGHLGLDADAFWSDPFSTSDELVRTLVRAREPAFVLDGPSRVNLDARSELPVVLHRVVTFADAAQVDLRENALIVAQDLDGRRVMVDRAFRPSPAPPPLDEPPQPGFTSDRAALDVRALVGVEWSPARWVVRVLLRDQVTNPVRVDLGRGEGAYRDEAVERFLEEQRGQVRSPAVAPPPGQPTPRYRPGDASPALADGVAGLALSAERVGVIGDGKPKPLHGSVRVPARAVWRVPADLGSEWAESFDGAPPRAIVPVTLLITDSESPTCTQVDLRVPAFEVVGEGDEALVDAWFTLDVEASLPGFVPKARTHFVYALCDEQFAGPVPVGLVTEDMLPR